MYFDLPVDTHTLSQFTRPVPAIHANAAESRQAWLPSFCGVGTGGIADLRSIKSSHGYLCFQIIDVEPIAPTVEYMPYVELMEEVKSGFGRTLSHLPAVFGVSRQTIYNWLAGEVPKEQHQAKLVQLAAAASVFVEAGFKPTAQNLERTVAHGKSLIDLLREGADGREMALKLVRIVKAGLEARDKVDALLVDRKALPLTLSDVGRRSFNEDV